MSIFRKLMVVQQIRRVTVVGRTRCPKVGYLRLYQANGYTGAVVACDGDGNAMSSGFLINIFTREPGKLNITRVPYIGITTRFARSLDEETILIDRTKILNQPAGC